MKLFEFEGKSLFKQYEIKIPEGIVVSEMVEIGGAKISYPVMIKAQLLSGKRGKRGLIKKVEKESELKAIIEGWLGLKVNGEEIKSVLVERVVDVVQELFVSITYSTRTRSPLLLVAKGGIEVESQASVVEMPLKVGMEIPPIKLEGETLETEDEKDKELLEAKIWKVVQSLWTLFQEKDLFLAEINPLVVTSSNQVIALDAKVVTDDAAEFRQKWELPERNMLGRDKSWAEIEAEKIDAQDHRGVVGRVYLDLEGDIGVIAAGGGASLVAMDALVGFGLKPANYTEFSGNPPKGKVKRLTEIVLAKKRLKGAILVGGKANFTDQVETLSGFLEALHEIVPDYPIVVRRDGPGMNEAKEMLEKAALENNWKIKVFDASVPIVESVRILVDMVAEKGKTFGKKIR